ncbi:peptidase S41 [Altererythrobacter sp. B11]|uniref:S41 family peptidase n=1 Tax=Altererythrobacter sp. B11 TaxID=2060312 RepID=UPI000DC72DF9|nr:S41 family peptidase [Altererythrobacter sp. B11]BBC74342.1 peptidase S41 [Altererythrobacter sp. B11]
MVGLLFSMRYNKFALSACGAALLAACGGGGGSSAAPSAGGSPTPTPSPSPSAAACSLGARQDWALRALDEWYLFPSLLDKNIVKSAYPDLQSYIDALVAPARAQSRDRYFTYVTSIEEENAYYEEGANAGFGFQLSLVGNALYVIDSYEGAPALAANIDRGTQILSIGTSSGTMQTVSSLLATGGTDRLVDALGPSTVGTTRVFRVRDASGVEREVALSASEYNIDPVSDRFGARIILDGAKKVGYLNLRTFIDTAEPDLRAAFAEFKAQGVTELIIDLRYNGGGLISVAELVGDLMGGGRSGQIFDYVTFRDSKSANNESRAFQLQPESISPTRIAFIGTHGTASASELVINGMVPYLRTNMALVGGNTYGKPVGQIALDRPECDDRLRAIALKIENADHQGEYYTGLASTVPVTCSAEDDLFHPLGDPQEAMVGAALDFLAGRACGTISAGARAAAPKGKVPLVPSQPSRTVQVELPGIY